MSKPGDPDFRPKDRPATALAMVQPICMRVGCSKMARFVPVAVFKPNELQAAVSRHPDADYEIRTPMPSAALCGIHADELAEHPDQMISEEGWRTMRQADLQNGRLPRDASRLEWELIEIPRGEVADQIGAAMKKHGVRPIQ